MVLEALCGAHSSPFLSHKTAQHTIKHVGDLNTVTSLLQTALGSLCIQMQHVCQRSPLLPLVLSFEFLGFSPPPFAAGESTVPI